MDNPKQVELFEQWVIVEVFGHEKYAGHVKESVVAGQGVLQLTVPAIEGEHPLPGFTKFLNPSSVFSLTVVAEEYAREMAKRLKKHPVSSYEHQGLIRDIAKKAVAEMKMEEIKKLLNSTPKPFESDADLLF